MTYRIIVYAIIQDKNKGKIILGKKVKSYSAQSRNL
jgi:hypothetical protein